MSNLEDRVTNLEALVARLVSGGSAPAPANGAARPAPASTTEGEVASDRDLDSQYGDPEVRKMPNANHWTGEDFTGAKLSRTSADFCDAFAKYKDACAYMNEQEGKPEKAKYITYDRRDAARARGWARRLRAAPPAPAPTDDAVEYAANGGEYPADMPF